MTKLGITALVTSLALVPLKGAQESGEHLFILSGQSNMAALDPGVSFIPSVAREFGRDHVIVVKDAENSAPIRGWYKGWKSAPGDLPVPIGAYYDRLMVKVQAAIKGKSLKTVTFVWMHGARDATEKHGDVYAASLKGLIDQLSQDLGRKDINVVIWRLNDFEMADATSREHWAMIRKAQVDVASSNSRFAWVDSDDLNGPDNVLHFDARGLETLGGRLAAKATELIKRQVQ